MLNQPLSQKGTTAMPNSLPEMLIIFGAPITHKNIISMTWDAATDEQKEAMLNDVKEFKASKGKDKAMRVFEVKRNLGNGVSVHHYYYHFPILNAHFTYRTMDAQSAAIVDSEMPHLLPWKRNELINKVSRELFWKLQGDILGSQA